MARLSHRSGVIRVKPRLQWETLTPTVGTSISWATAETRPAQYSCLLTTEPIPYLAINGFCWCLCKKGTQTLFPCSGLWNKNANMWILFYAKGSIRTLHIGPLKVKLGQRRKVALQILSDIIQQQADCLHPNEFSCSSLVSGMNRIPLFFFHSHVWTEVRACCWICWMLCFNTLFGILSWDGDFFFFLSFDFFILLRFSCQPLFKHSLFLLIFFQRCSSSLSPIAEWYHTVRVHCKFNCSQDLYRLDVLHISGISTINRSTARKHQTVFSPKNKKKNVAFLAKCSNPFSEVFVVLWATVAFTVKASILKRGLLSYCFFFLY